MPAHYQNDKGWSSNALMASANRRRYKSRVHDIQEIRRERLRAYASAIGGQAKLANELAISESQVSQIIGRNPIRNIGTRQAREIERKLRKPIYWLDDLTDGLDAESLRIAHAFQPLKAAQREIVWRQIALLKPLQQETGAQSAAPRPPVFSRRSDRVKA